MPINPNALGASEPDEPVNEASPAQADAEEQSGKRKRRTKTELIADAVVPGNNDLVFIKESGTGAKVERPWLVAVEMVRDEKAEWVDKAMKYAMLKYDEQKAERERESKSPHIPDDAQPGDEVQIGDETVRVGHGGVLTTSPVVTDDPPAPATADTNGKGGDDVVQVETERQSAEIRQVGEIEWKVGTGILEKIGLPQVEQYAAGSSLAVGPNTASYTVIDDGRRTTVQIGEREASLPTAVIEAYQDLTDMVEYVARYQRGQLLTFLESTGALKQSVSS